ncbi:dihydrolipoyl dehydrogenase family protein [Mesorhizobium australicum]|uniref:Pyruvate/2-oxoglutarate dehydrogenase complex, dihydrolipoamide dehydrogenase (E3) component n=1 Tax=Mesorhizobium australicum TaxID=536018 RepID=A0A1X7NGU7_9HYPH|nr:FAD-dependent oxidoreductase [Mesorhizobium australicum]SMH36346.1 Pyruvate/2-oxoglutarate dehydrogenase complex, dihydrolipoamide dehydrogenase (E3) component [Mesorhizobium australicum]
METLRPDICVIGAGSAGLSVAAAAAAFGVQVVLVEKGRMGGDCLNYGCVPSKALIAAGRQAQAMREAARFGIAPVEPEVDFRQVHGHVHDVIAAIAPNDSVERFTALGVQVIQAEARFADRRTVVAGEFEIRARRFVVATGSRPVIPPIEGIGTIDVLTNETIFDLTRRPGHLVVIGGGPIGVELAQAHRRLGSDVTIIEGTRALGREDPEIAGFALRALREEGVAIREAATVTRVERRGKTGVRVHVETADGAETVDGTHLLVAAGRAPNVEGLDLAKARIALSDKGIKVNDRLRTANRRVYAIGDVAGGPQFTHVAGYHASLILRPLLFRLSARVDTSIIPRVTYCDPELAQVGLTEAEAMAVHKGVRILRWPLSENDRAQAERRTAGLAKLIVSSRGRVLGASIVGANAGEMIGLYGLAIGKGMGVKDLASWLPPYPTMGEIGKRAAIAYFAGVTRKPLVRALIRFMRIFG